MTTSGTPSTTARSTSTGAAESKTGRDKVPALGASDRVTLYLALVPYLLQNSPVSVAEAASRFQVTPADMRDLVRKLSNLGIPGTEGYYLPNDLFEINFDLFEDNDIIDLLSAVGIVATPKFSGTEAATLVAGLQFISGIVAAEERASVATLIEKIGLGASAKPSSIFVATPEPPACFELLRMAFSQNCQVRFHYRNAHGAAEMRSVSPLRLDLVGDTWYLRGWCHLRDALRTFRLDRIDEMVVTDRQISLEEQARTLPDVLFDVRETDFAVVVRLAEEALPLIAEYHPDVHSAAAGGQLLATIHFAHLTNLSRMVARYPGIVQVIEPPEAIRAVAEYAREARARYI